MIGSNGIHTDLERRVDTYRNKPQELQQRYAMSQELIDLLALQKLTAEKKAAAQHMALQAGAGGPPPTIAQQREQEAMQLTKQEVAQQQGALLQQQQGEKQKRLQQMTDGGLGGLPAPNVATPQAMAAGGIVDMGDDEGYNEGGTVRSERNNNPGNLIYNDYTRSLGAVGRDKDGFAVFPDPQTGAAALTANLRNYGSKGINTIESIIERWAPSKGAGNSPESTRNYTNFVASQLGVRPSDPVDMTDPRVLQMLNASIQRFEGGPQAGIVGLSPQYAQADTGTRSDASSERVAEEPPVTPEAERAANRRALAAPASALGDVLTQPFTGLGNLFSKGVSGTQNAISRAVNAIADREVLPTDVEYPTFSPTPFTDRFARDPDAEIREARATQPPVKVGIRPDDPANMARRFPGPGPGRIDVNGAVPPAPDEAGLSALISARAGASGPAGLSPADNDFRTFIKGQAAEQLGRNPLAEAGAEEARANAAFGMTPEQIANRQKVLAGLEAIDAKRFDPKRMKDEQLTRLLLGMGGRSTLGSVAQGAGAASINYRNEMEALERNALGGRGSMQDSIFEDQRKIREKAFGSRAPVMKDVEAARNQGIVSGAGMSNTDVNADVQRDSTAAQRESNQIGARANDFARLAQARNSLQQAKTQRLKIATGDIDKQIDMLEFQRDKNGQIPPNLAPRYRELTLERRRLLNAVEDEFADIERSIIVRMGGGAGAGGLDQWGNLNQK